MNDNGVILHEQFNALKRYSFNFDRNVIFKNGLYVLFEKGEKFLEFDRIVRVGTHTGQNNLVKRLTEHFLKPNKDRSIFRKHIGRAILSRDNNLELLKQWEIDLTGKKAREEWAGKIDTAAIKSVEDRVTAYMQEYFTFSVIPLETKEERLFFEAGIIATTSRSPHFYPSANWLGKFSPEEKIRTRGVWLVHGLNGRSLTEAEMGDLIKCAETSRLKELNSKDITVFKQQERSSENASRDNFFNKT